MEAVIMKKIKIEFTNERIIPASGLAVVGAILGKSDFVKRCNRMDVTPNRSQHQIKNGDVLLTYIGLLTMGKPAYESVHEFDDDPDFYKYALGIVRSIPSEETLRQRMDDIGSSMRSYILAENIKMLRDNGIVPGKLPNGYVPVMSRPLTIPKPKSRVFPELIRDVTAMRRLWHILERKAIWSTVNSGKENSIARSIPLSFYGKPSVCAGRSRMNHS